MKDVLDDAALARLRAAEKYLRSRAVPQDAPGSYTAHVDCKSLGVVLDALAAERAARERAEARVAELETPHTYTLAGGSEDWQDIADTLAEVNFWTPVEVRRMHELPPRWVVRVPIGDDEGFVEDVELDWFDTHAQAAEPCRRALAPATPETPA